MALSLSGVVGHYLTILCMFWILTNLQERQAKVLQRKTGILHLPHKHHHHWFSQYFQWLLIVSIWYFWTSCCFGWRFLWARSITPYFTWFIWTTWVLMCLYRQNTLPCLHLLILLHSDTACSAFYPCLAVSSTFEWFSTFLYPNFRYLQWRLIFGLCGAHS